MKHTHTIVFCEKWGHLIGVTVFYTVQTVCAIALHLTLSYPLQETLS